MTPFFLAAGTLWKREIVRFLRQPSRVAGAFGPPVLFWVLIGSGLGDSFQSAGVNYLQYFFPGTVTLIVLFTAIFSTISIIEDRHEGFLQSVWVAPISRGSLVLGKIAGGTTLAFVQGLIFICLSPLVGISLRPLPFIYLLVILFLISFGLTGLGFLIAWRLDSTQGFHAIMNLVLIPMWLLSGALFPIAGAPDWLRAIMRVNPLSYGVSALGGSFLVHGQRLQTGLASPAVWLGAIFAFAVLTFSLSVLSARKS